MFEGSDQSVTQTGVGGVTSEPSFISNASAGRFFAALALVLLILRIILTSLVLPFNTLHVFDSDVKGQRVISDLVKFLI